MKTAGLEFAEIEEADFILARGMFTMHDSEDILFREGVGAGRRREGRMCVRGVASRQ